MHRNASALLLLHTIYYNPFPESKTFWNSSLRSSKLLLNQSRMYQKNTSPALLPLSSLIPKRAVTLLHISLIPKYEKTPLNWWKNKEKNQNHQTPHLCNSKLILSLFNVFGAGNCPVNNLISVWLLLQIKAMYKKGFNVEFTEYLYSQCWPTYKMW